jgi:hypothetical protein
MKKQLIIFALLATFSFMASAQNKRVQAKILYAMQQQEKSWDNGDIEGYMSYYWNSDSLKFIVKSGVTYGWQSTLDHYKKAYPDKEAMGKLIFGDIRMTKLKCHLVMITGSWKLERTSGNIEGYYSLIWKKIKGKWVITVDHTS